MRQSDIKVEYKQPAEVLKPFLRFDFITQLHDYLEVQLEKRFPDLHNTLNDLWSDQAKGHYCLHFGAADNQFSPADLFIFDSIQNKPVLEFFLDSKNGANELKGRFVLEHHQNEYLKYAEELIRKFVDKNPQIILDHLPTIASNRRVVEAEYASLDARDQNEIASLMPSVKLELVKCVQKQCGQGCIESMRDLHELPNTRYRVYDRYSFKEGKIEDYWLGVFDSAMVMDVAEIRIVFRSGLFGFNRKSELSGTIVKLDNESSVLEAIEHFVQFYDLREISNVSNLSQYENLLRRLKSLDPCEAKAAMKECASADDPKILDALIDNIDSLLLEIREAAVATVTSRSDMQTLQALRRAAASGSWRCEELLLGKNPSQPKAHSLSGQSVSTVHSLIADLDDLLLARREAATRELGRQLETIVPILIETIKTSQQNKIIEECVKLLGNSTDSRAANALREIVAQSKRYNGYVVSAAKRSLAHQAKLLD